MSVCPNCKDFEGQYRELKKEFDEKVEEEVVKRNKHCVEESHEAKDDAREAEKKAHKAHERSEYYKSEMRWLANTINKRAIDWDR